jgi:hypothetical protein
MQFAIAEVYANSMKVHPLNGSDKPLIRSAQYSHEAEQRNKTHTEINKIRASLFCEDKLLK